MAGQLQPWAYEAPLGFLEVDCWVEETARERDGFSASAEGKSCWANSAYQNYLPNS